MGPNSSGWAAVGAGEGEKEKGNVCASVIGLVVVEGCVFPGHILSVSPARFLTLLGTLGLGDVSEVLTASLVSQKLRDA